MEQKWFGWVEEINDMSFNVRLKNLSSDNGLDSIAEIPYTDITKNDRKTIQLGSTFHWTTTDDSSIIEFTKEPNTKERKISEKAAKEYYESMVKYLKFN